MLADRHEAPTALGDQVTRRCAACGYDLRGLVEPRCPECGAEFDPEARPSQIPWLAYEDRNPIEQYVQTAHQALLEPARIVTDFHLGDEIDARRCRAFRTVSATIGVASLMLTGMLVIPTPVGPGLIVGLILGAIASIIGATAVHVVHAGLLLAYECPPNSMRRARMSSFLMFTTSALALMPMVPVLTCLGLIVQSLIGRSSGALPALLAGLALLSVLGVWFVSTCRLLGRYHRSGGADVVVDVLAVLLGWSAAALVGVAASALLIVFMGLLLAIVL